MEGAERGPRATPPSAPGAARYAGIAAAAAGVIVLEIGLTRIFSYTIWYHFAYLAISMALLGFGASGSFLTAFPGIVARRGFLSWASIAAQLGTFVCLVVLSNVSLDPLALARDPGQLLRLVLYYVAVVIPFFAGGLLVAGPLMASPERVSRLYFWDLLGAGAACGLFVPLVWAIGTPAATACATLAFGAAAIAYAVPEIRARQAVIAAAVAALTVAHAVSASFTPAATKFVAQLLASPGAALGYHRWTPINRVDVVTFDPAPRTGSYMGWGLSPRFAGEGPPFYMVGNDGDSCAVMYQWDGKPESLEFLRHHVISAPYLLLDEPDVLAIGLGGGVDALSAILHGARSFVGVEINPVTVHAGREVYAEWNGNVLNHPRVEPVVAEGRGFLRSRGSSYDLIEINSVDTLSALSTGAYVISESYLYTADAVGDYLDHLRPRGLFAMVVGDVVARGEAPRHTLRLASIVRRALDERGVAEPGRHVAVVASPENVPLVHTLVRNEPFDEAELAPLDEFVESRGFVYWHRPGRRFDTRVSQILTSPPAQLDAFYARHALNLRPTTDDSPFFFNFYKWRTLLGDLAGARLSYQRAYATGQIVLLVMLVQSSLFAALLILLPLVRVPRSGGGTALQRAAWLAYFSALGAGFILLEISFIQRFVLFLGYPTYSLTVVLLALLVSTGVGSWLTDRVRSGFEEKLPSRLVLLLAMVGAYLVAVPWIFDALLGAPLAVRIAVAISLLAPLGLVLGGFLPLGVRVLERTNRQLVPWAWAVNGCATVVGTILAVIGGMTWSFTTVALAACAIYAAGVAALVAAERRARGASFQSP